MNLAEVLSAASVSDASVVDASAAEVAGSMRLAAAPSLAKVQNVKGYDASGNPLTPSFDAATGVASFTAAPAKVTYDYRTGYKDMLMDVTLTRSAAPDTPGAPNTPNTPDTSDTSAPNPTDGVGSSGGCDASSFGGLALAALAAFALKGKGKR